VRTDCVPFSEIPHTSRIFLDYLAHSPTVQNFYPRSPFFRDWVKAEAAEIHPNRERCAAVAASLERQNRDFGSSENARRNIDRLRRGAFTVVTGQQVGLFGGPLFSILKAISAVKTAAEITAMGIDCVPVFWLASEDHDLAEVNHNAVIGSNGTLHELRTEARGKEDSPVGDVIFTDEINVAIETFAAQLGPSPVLDFLRESYRPGENFASGFGKLFARLFAEWGVILLDPRDADLHRIANPVFVGAVTHADEINRDLLARGRELQAAGYEEQVKVTPSSSLLFCFESGQRVPIRRAGGRFTIADREISPDKLATDVAAHPEHFSANVLLRPIMQDFLLPNLAYIGGAAEIAYFAQIAVVYRHLLGRITPVLPRYSATIVESRQATLLKKYAISFTELLRGSDNPAELLASRVLDPNLIAKFERASSQIDSAMKSVTSALQQLDPTLVDSAEKAQAKMLYQIEQLQGRAARAQARRTEDIQRHAELLSSSLFPHKTLQEREIAGIYFLARHGLELLHTLYGAVQTDCNGHHVLYLES